MERLALLKKTRARKRTSKVLALHLLSLALLPEALWAGQPSASFSVNLVRTAEEVEKRFVRVGIQMDLTDLSMGANSVAKLSVPKIGFDEVVAMSVRGARGTFSFTADFANFDDINGEWSLLINNGHSPNENLSFTISGIGESSMPSFPGYPQLAYQSRYNEVFVPFRSVIGIEAGATSSPGTLSTRPVTNGIVYTFPDGGPFFASASRSRDLPTFGILNGLGQTFFAAQFVSAKSENRSDFYISEEPLEFGLSTEISRHSGRLYGKGMTQGLRYQVLHSTDLSVWSTIEDFTSQSNAFRLEFETQPGSGFFRMIEQN